MTLRLFVGAAIALVIVLLARRAHALSSHGALTAFGVGTVAMLAGWSWGALLIAYFLTSSALSRYGAAAKEARTGDIVEKGRARDAVQVLANGALFTLAAALFVAGTLSTSAASALGAGTLAASASDTWATEIGTLAKAPPRSILTLRPVAPGVSGGITLIGTLAAIAGAGFIAVVAFALGWPARATAAAFAGGVAGSTIDSILGAALQSRRWCDRCDRITERRVHRCGALTRHRGGLRWLDNDVVNFVTSAAGGLFAMLLAR